MSGRCTVSKTADRNRVQEAPEENRGGDTGCAPDDRRTQHSNVDDGSSSSNSSNSSNSSKTGGSLSSIMRSSSVCIPAPVGLSAPTPSVGPSVTGNVYCMYCTVLYCTTLCYIVLLYTALLYSTLLCSTLHCTTLLYSTLHYTALLYTTLHYTALLYFLTVFTYLVGSWFCYLLITIYLYLYLCLYLYQYLYLCPYLCPYLCLILSPTLIHVRYLAVLAQYYLSTNSVLSQY